jgi:hypothetical protein
VTLDDVNEILDKLTYPVNGAISFSQEQVKDIESYLISLGDPKNKREIYSQTLFDGLSDEDSEITYRLITHAIVSISNMYSPWKNKGPRLIYLYKLRNLLKQNKSISIED